VLPEGGCGEGAGYDHDVRTATSAGSTAARAAAVAAVSTLVAGFGHAAGHGAVPDASALLLTVVAATGLGLVLARAGWTPLRLVAVLVAVQVAVHGAAWIGGGTGGGVDPRLAGLAPPAPVHHAAPFSARMLLAHGAAVVAAALLLLALDRACGFLAHVARRVLQPVRRILVPAPVRRVRPAQTRPLSLLAAPHLVVVRGNAPPVLLGIG
jgi:hypothetical protein